MRKRAVILFVIALTAGIAGFAMAYVLARPDAFGAPQSFPPDGIESTLGSPDLACGRFKLVVEGNGPSVRISPGPGADPAVDSALLVERSKRAITIIAQAERCSYRMTIEKHVDTDRDGLDLLLF
ncbi:MAG TPA: hypothetical protein VKS78_09130 [Roseiarcus sp.]|nr:hypothetical protein [Roseiarcus sp.]